jgi:uncharacterized membrane protein YhdT
MTVEKKTIKKFKWFWAWQDEAEEAWLGEMSKKGYHLVSAGVPCIYEFDTGEPKDYVYRLDFQTFHKKDREEYLQLFRDAGWEHLGQMGTWQYFRKEAKQGEADEIYTDNESKMGKYKRVLFLLGFFYVILIAVSAGRLWGESPYPWFNPWFDGIKIFTALVFVVMTYAIIRLLLRIRKLQKY